MKYLFLLVFFISSAFCHPHTFIEIYPTIYSKDNKIEKINMKWKIDEITSMMLIMEFDMNSNGKIDEDENQFIYENYFITLERYNYYIDIQSNRSTSLPVIPQNFKAQIQGNIITYSFDLEEVIKIPNIKINFFDETLYVGLIIKEEYIKYAKQNYLHSKKLFGLN